jgi:hypothetical protein
MLLMSEARTIEPGSMLGFTQPAGAERRRGLRVRQNRPIKVYEPSSHRYFGGQTEDVSATGLRVEMPVSTPVCEGRLVSIHVGLSNRGEALANRRQMMPARVVWVRRSSDRSQAKMMVGLELVASVAAHLDAA